MVDWDRVEELRSKGWEWERVATDPKTAFHPDPGITDAGRALRALYRRRLRTAQRGEPAPKGAAGKKVGKPRWTLLRAGMLLTPLFGVWFLLAFFIRSPIGTYVPAIPLVALGLAVSGFALAFGLLKAADRWNAVLRRSATLGVVLGVVVAGGLGLVALAAGCPTLTGIPSGAPGQWQKVANPLWSDNGMPVFFFLGSTACPYCSATSWAIQVALDRIGSLSGVTYSASNPGDIYPNTPEVVLAGTNFSSSSLEFQVAESTDNMQVTLPAFANCVQRAYFSAYNLQAAVPFMVVGGHYLKVGPNVDPAALQGLSTTQLRQQIQSQSGGGWTAVQPGADWLTAYLLKIDGGLPASAAQIPTVAQDLAQIPVP